MDRDERRLLDTPAHRRGRRRRWFLLSVLALGCLLGYGVYSMGRMAVPTGPAAASTQGQAAPQATQTILANTAEPTGAAGAEYRTAAEAALIAWETSAAVLVEQGQEVQANSALLDDAAWRNDTVRALTAVQQSAQDLRSLPPAPAGYEAVDQSLTVLADASDRLTSDVNAVLGGSLTALFALQGDANATLAADEAARRALEAASPA